MAVLKHLRTKMPLTGVGAPGKSWVVTVSRPSCEKFQATYSDGQKSCTFFLEFFLWTPWGRGANFETGQFCDLEDSILQNWPVSKLAPLPQGGHEKNSRKNVQDFCPSLYIPIRLWWNCSNHTRSKNLVRMNFTDLPQGSKLANLRELSSMTFTHSGLLLPNNPHTYVRTYLKATVLSNLTDRDMSLVHKIPRWLWYLGLIHVQINICWSCT